MTTTDKLNYKDVTNDWIKNRKNYKSIIDANYFEHNGKKYYVDGKKVVLDYSTKEKEVALWLVNTFGGELYMLPKINKPDGIYYSYENSINVLPNDFTSKKASMYLGCIELIAEFDTAKHQLQFVVDWLQKNKNENEKWDMGKNAKDGLYYPLSDDWRKKEKREFDCTYRISNLLQKLNS
jgi:hypothetical protein